MRLGGYVFVDVLNPETWITKHVEKGFRSAVVPINHTASETEKRDYQQIALAHDVMLAEVGAWSNPLHTNIEKQRQAIDYLKKQLAFADELGARVCINIAGSLGTVWDGPHPDHYQMATFEKIATVVQEIIDDVQPKTTDFCLEMMPHTPPSDSFDYQKLIDWVNRDHFKVHFDPVNIINSPKRYYKNGRMIEDFIETLGPHIRSAHLKDITLTGHLTVQLNEVIPGEGSLDYSILLQSLNQLDPDLPVIIEHLNDEASYDQASAYIKSIAKQYAITL
ncbi:sugar phosphate isomerase/epimerase [Streptohalobacillus salinus]|uniref:Sugar phosphate isomerase/epimerase n=1 Tax=Streptohalobacillus salinus TaxID=621096 RepID=A0A2V3WE08_9BACI|nr:TIM barrel protein [Streptohalobacillus salinus]PXW93146.1 sugar phosphate isomerase/epimerase [Streptohalobacillus salinus]